MQDPNSNDLPIENDAPDQINNDNPSAIQPIISDEPSTEMSDNVPVQPLPATASAQASLDSPVVNSADIVTPEEIQAAIALEPEKKKFFNFSKKMSIILIASAALLLIGSSVSSYVFLYSNPKKVVYDAISGMLKASAFSVNSTTLMTVGSDEVDSEITTQAISSIEKITVNYVSTNKPSGSVDVGVSLSYNDKSYSVAAKGMFLETGDLYFRFDNILDSLQQAFGDQTLPQELKDQISALEGTWVKYGISDIRKQSEEAANSYQCALDAYKKLNKDNIYQAEYFSLYEKSPFLVIDESSVQNKDGKYGYSISIDAQLLYDYSQSLSEIDSNKEIAKCLQMDDISSDQIKIDDQQMSDMQKALDKINMVMWVDQWSHSMNRVEVSYDDNQYNTKISINNDSKIVIDDKLTIVAPAQSKQLDEWLKDVEKLYQTYYGG